MTVTLHPDIEELIELNKVRLEANPDDFLPVVHVHYQEPPHVLLGLPVDNPGAIVEAFAPEFGAKSDRGIIWSAFIGDTYCLQEPASSDIEGIVHGELAKRFEAGDSKVTEALCIDVVGRVGNVLGFVPYVRTEAVFDWKDPIIYPNCTGRIVEALKMMVAASWINREEHA